MSKDNVVPFKRPAKDFGDLWHSVMDICGDVELNGKDHLDATSEIVNVVLGYYKLNDLNRMDKLLQHIHDKAMVYIDTITGIGIDELELTGNPVDPKNISLEAIAEGAARRLGLPIEQTVKGYIDMMILEEMAEK